MNSIWMLWTDKLNINWQIDEQKDTEAKNYMSPEEWGKHNNIINFMFVNLNNILYMR